MTQRRSCVQGATGSKTWSAAALLVSLCLLGPPSCAPEAPSTSQLSQTFALHDGHLKTPEDVMARLLAIGDHGDMSDASFTGRMLGIRFRPVSSVRTISDGRRIQTTEFLDDSSNGKEPSVVYTTTSAVEADSTPARPLGSMLQIIGIDEVACIPYSNSKVTATARRFDVNASAIIFDSSERYFTLRRRLGREIIMHPSQHAYKDCVRSIDLVDQRTVER